MTFTHPTSLKQASLKLLPKKIVLRGTNQFPRPTASTLISIAANDARGSACQFAADQSRRTSEFVGDCVHRGVQRIAMRIAAPPVVDQRPHSCNADRNFSQTLPP